MQSLKPPPVLPCKVAESVININPAGVFIDGPIVLIKSGALAVPRLQAVILTVQSSAQSSKQSGQTTDNPNTEGIEYDGTVGGDNARHPLETEAAPPAIEADDAILFEIGDNKADPEADAQKADCLKNAAGNANAFVKGNEKAVKAPEQTDDGFGVDDAASLTLDSLPVVGSLKSIAQLITGTDLVTGEPVNRGMEALGVFAGIIPGAKGALKGVMLGAKVLKKADKAKDAAKIAKRADKASDVKGVKSVDDIPEHTYRGDSRSPDEIFDKGFEPRAKGSDTSLEDYARNNTPSDYVGTSKNRDVAQDFADGDGYVYTVKSDKGVDVNKELGNRSPFPNEQEVVIPGGVKPGDIKGATPVNKDGSLGNSTVLNPNHYKKPNE